ncbi:Present in the outer mitochondrial membrane proteome 24 [Trypanosoma cruzi]|uniref:Present in the outer mitochondrial membrane proteome 24 n=3 Tax=Trypanosoma cruzi TaxID=5693 RepID=A0A2V2XCE3_TRYCR|nr:Present in the outer mitochondrial membrane proteome 24 [Trypanosoma cruzi]
MSRGSFRLIAVSCAAVSVSAAALIFRLVKNRGRREDPSFETVPVSQWTVQQVAQWLRSRGISEEAVMAFCRNNIDSSVLFLLDEGENIAKLAPKIRDQILIRRGLRELRDQETYESAGAQTSSASETCTREAEEDRVAAFLMKLNAITSMLTSNEYETASPTIQRRQRQECMECSQALLGEVQHFAPGLRVQLIPLVRRVEGLIIPPPTRVTPATAAEPSDLETQLITLHEMVDGFLRVLDSTDTHVISDPQIALLRERVESQISHVMEVASRLPPQYGEPLRKKCELVLQRIQHGSTAAASGSAVESTQAAPEPQATLLAPMVKRLREVFTSLKSSALVNMEPAGRLARIAEMLKDVRNIQQEAASSGDARAVEVVNQVAGNVVMVLEQMEALTREEMASMRANVIEETDEDQSAQAELPQIFTSLQAIIKVLHSDKLARAPHEVKQQILSRLQKGLRPLRQQIAGLPLNQATASVAEMIEKSNELVDSLLDRQEGPHEGLEAKQENEEEEEEGTAPEEAEGSRERPLSSRLNPPVVERQGNVLDEALLELEKMFEYINSDEYERMSPKKKSDTARRNLIHLINIENRCAQFDGFDQLRELIDPMKDILRTGMRKKEERPTPGPTPLFLNISAHLQQMNTLMNSDGFQRADLNKKKNAARSIIPQLQKITSTLSLLPPHERAAVERLLAPVNETLKSIVARNENNSENLTDPQRVVAEVEEVLSTLQSEDFRTAPVQQQQNIVRQLLQRVERLKEGCAQLGRAANPLLTILHRLTTQLQSFGQVGRYANAAAAAGLGETADVVSNEVDEADEGNSDDNNDNAEEVEDEMPATNGGGRRGEIVEERRKLFKAVTDITSELRKSNNNNIILSAEEAQPLLGLLEMVDSVGCTTAYERRLRDEFENQIQRASGNGDVTGEAGSVNLQKLVRTFSLLKDRLSASPPVLPTEMVSLMTTVEEALSAADEQNVPWRRLPQVVNLIGEVLTAIQQRQAEMREQFSTGEEDALNETAPDPCEDPPQSEEPVGTGANVTSQLQGDTGDTPSDALEGLQNPQTAARDSTRLPDANLQAEEEVEGNETRIARLLLEMSEQLRDGSVPDELLDRYSMLLDLVGSSYRDPSLLEAVESIREQIRLQRISNRDTSSEEYDSSEENMENEKVEEGEVYKSEETSSKLREDAGQEKVFGESKESSIREDTLATQSTELEPTTDDQGGEDISKDNMSKSFLSQLSRNCVPGGARNELLLLPRIEKRIFSDEQHFIENTTLSDIQNVSKVILHIEKNNDVKDNPSLRDRVKRVKQAFARQLEAFHGSDQQAIAVHSSLKLCCRDTVTSDESIREFFICTSAEAEEFGEMSNNNELVRSLTEGTPAQTTVLSEVVKQWTGRSKAVIFCEGAGSMGGTELSELVLLREVLVNRYGFEVFAVTDSNASKMSGILQEIASLGTKRLFLFCLTQSDSPSSPLTFSFNDGSVLPLRDALQEALDIERVVLVHCQRMKLTILSALNGRGGTFLSVELTEAARNELRAGRCWLFDNLLTPAVTELLSLDEKPMLCPEDLVTYTITALTSLRVEFGSFTEGETLRMGFFVPCDLVE